VPETRVLGLHQTQGGPCVVVLMDIVSLIALVLYGLLRQCCCYGSVAVTAVLLRQWQGARDYFMGMALV
jgi:hypothetical protein